MTSTAYKHSHFPSIPTVSRLRSSTTLLKLKRTLSPRPHHSPSPYSTQLYNSINSESTDSSDKLLSHFLIKYLERK